MVRTLEPVVGELRAGDPVGISLYAFPLDPLPGPRHRVRRGAGARPAGADGRVAGSRRPALGGLRARARRDPRGGAARARRAAPAGADRGARRRTATTRVRPRRRRLLPPGRDRVGGHRSGRRLRRRRGRGGRRAGRLEHGRGARLPLPAALAAGRPRVSAAVLDAPLLDWSATLRNAAARRGRAPRRSRPPAKQWRPAGSACAGATSTTCARPRAFATPMLIVHGTDDRTVPFETSRRLALARPDLVQLVAVPGAGHARSWNRDPEGYDHRRRRLSGRDQPAGAADASAVIRTSPLVDVAFSRSDSPSAVAGRVRRIEVGAWCRRSSS